MATTATPTQAAKCHPYEWIPLARRHAKRDLAGAGTASTDRDMRDGDGDGCLPRELAPIRSPSWRIDIGQSD